MNIIKDIENLNKFIELVLDKNYCDCNELNVICDGSKNVAYAVKKLLEEREEDKNKIEELEAKLEFKEWGDLDNLKFEEYMKEFIPKQKVIDKMEQLNKEIKNGDEIEAIFKIKQQQILQELLEEKQ